MEAPSPWSGHARPLLSWGTILRIPELTLGTQPAASGGTGGADLLHTRQPDDDHHLAGSGLMLVPSVLKPVARA